MQKPLFNKLELKLAKIYKIHPYKAMGILSDIYFFVDFFLSSTIDKRIKYGKVRDIIWLNHDIKFPKTTIRRWYLAIKKQRSSVTDY